MLNFSYLQKTTTVVAQHKLRHCLCVSHLTVHVIVTHPVGWDTGGVSTLELAGGTGGQRTLHLIRAVATVVLAVTHKVPGDAATAGTGEFIGRTGDVSCSSNQMVNTEVCMCGSSHTVLLSV